MKLREWNARLHGLVVFRSLLDDPVVAKLVDLTDRMEAGAPGYGPVCDAVAQFEAALFEHTTNWGSYLSAAVLEAETVCVRQAASGTLAPALQTALDSELAFLQALCGLTLDELLAAAGSATGQAQELAFLPRWERPGRSISITKVSRNISVSCRSMPIRASLSRREFLRDGTSLRKTTSPVRSLGRLTTIWRPIFR